MIGNVNDPFEMSTVNSINTLKDTTKRQSKLIVKLSVSILILVTFLILLTLYTVSLESRISTLENIFSNADAITIVENGSAEVDKVENKYLE